MFMESLKVETNLMDLGVGKGSVCEREMVSVPFSSLNLDLANNMEQ